MALPPATITIKRPRDEDPIEFLRIQETNGKSKRRLTTDFVFTRQVESAFESPSTLIPTHIGEHDQLRRIKPLPRSVSSQHLSAHPSPQVQSSEAQLGVHENGEGQAATNTTQSLNSTPNTPLSQRKQPRNFHLSRSESSTPSASSVRSGRVQKAPALFVERRLRARATPASSPFKPVLVASPAQITPPAPALKRPGQAARTFAAPKSTPTSSLTSQSQDVRLPSGASLADQQLVEEMQRYTLQEIGINIAESDATEAARTPVPISLKKPSRFKPTIPKLRYHERHPEEFVNQDNEMEEDEVEIDESDYITETYIRVPVEVMELESNAFTNFGFLVLEGQEDIDEFYSGEIDSDEDEEYDEEDENAENHYSADYPDDEVDSDDEYGRNPYQYADDDDEEETYSDDDDGRRYAWAKQRPSWMPKTGAGGENGGEEW